MHYVPGSPILKSRDLVNWEMVGYAVDRYEEDPRYDMQGGTLYLNGSWANSIRYHNGKFYVAFCTPYGWGTEKGISRFVRQIVRKDRGSEPFSLSIYMIRVCSLTMMGKCMLCMDNIVYISQN